MAKMWFAQYLRTHNIYRLENALDCYRRALKHIPAGDPCRSGIIQGLAMGLHARCRDHTGDANDVIAEAISLQREVLELRPPGDLSRDDSLHHLAEFLLRRYEQTGDEKDLGDAIRLNREALECRPPSGTMRNATLTNLATCLQHRHWRFKDTAAIAEAIRTQREIVGQSQPGGQLYFLNRLGLANSLLSRYSRTMDAKDLDEATTVNRETLGACPQWHTHRDKVLDSLALCMQAHFRRQKIGPQYIAEAIRLYRETLECRPAGNPRRSTPLVNLAYSLSLELEFVDTG